MWNCFSFNLFLPLLGSPYSFFTHLYLLKLCKHIHFVRSYQTWLILILLMGMLIFLVAYKSMINPIMLS
jgi:hypothetical protein